jgi:hypothetical protein
MTIDEKIAVLEAAKAGKMIEFRDHGTNNPWWEVLNPIFNFVENDYRVKPPRVPREYVIHDEGFYVTAFATPPTNWQTCPHCALFREVLPDAE